MQCKKLYSLYKTGITFFNKKGRIRFVKYPYYFIILLTLSIFLFAFFVQIEESDYYKISDYIYYVTLVVSILSIYLDIYTYRRRIS